MGINGFFNSLNKRYNITDKISDDHKILCKYLILDFNAIIHNISEYVIKHINKLLKLYLIHTNQGIDFDKTISNELNISNYFENFNPKNEDEIYTFFNNLLTIEFVNTIIFQKIQDYIIYILNNCCITDKLELLYICIDGVPSKAKIITQRKRGFVGKFISTEKKKILKNIKNLINIEPDTFNNLPYNHYKFHNNQISFNKNFIKPATDFMIKLVQDLKSKEFFQKIRSIGNIKIMIDDFNNPGEAEHKFIQYILNNGLNKDVCVHSPDADLIILLLNLQIENLSLMRFNQQHSNLEDSFENFLIEEINLNKFKNYLFELVKDDIKINDDMKHSCILDISMLYSFFGNDFIANIESLTVYNIDYIPLIYSQVYNKLKKNLIIKTTKYIINSEFLTEIFKILSENENTNLKQIIISSKYKNIDKLKKNISRYSDFYLNNSIEDIDIIEFVDKYNNSRILDLFNEKKNIDSILKKKILNRDYLEFSDVEATDLSDKEILKFVKKNKFYLESSDLFSNFVDKNTGLIIIKKNLETLNSWYHKNNVKDLDLFEKEIYKLDKLLEENLHFYYEVKLTSNIKKYKKEFYKKFIPKQITIEQICQNYIQMLAWIVDTYINQNIRLGEYYQFYKAPFCEDIYNFLKKKIKLENKKSVGFTPTPLEHLLLVTPLDLNSLENNLKNLLDTSYSDATIKKIIDVFQNKLDGHIVSDLFYKNGITLDCFDSRFIGACHVYNEHTLFDKYDEFITQFRKNLPIENQESISQFGGTLSIKYIMKISKYKNKYYETRDIKYKHIYKSYKRKLFRLI